MATTKVRMAPEARREQLLDVTADLVLREGYGAVSIDRVAREATIARTVVYAQFGNLQGLLEALVDRTQRRASAGGTGRSCWPGWQRRRRRR